MAQRISSLPTGALVQFGTYGGNPIIWKVIGTGHDGYPTGSVTLLTKDIITKHAFDAKEPNSTLSDAKSYGNNTYQYSNILQWLNSTAAGGSWFSKQHTADQAPDSTSYVSESPYASEAGFLNAFTSDERSYLLDTETTAEHYNNSAVGYGTGTTQTNTSKIFLLSCTEVGLSGGQVCGVQFSDVFTDNASRIAYYNGTAAWWWLRDANSSSAYYVRRVYTDGTLNRYSAYNGDGGVRPACNLKSNIWVSDSPNASGAYEIGGLIPDTLQVLYPATPLAADDMPTKAMASVIGSFVGADTVKVEVCNNAYDATPTWEDCTNGALYGQKIFLKNTEKTADKWGIQFRLTAQRGDSDGDIYLSGASGTYA